MKPVEHVKSYCRFWKPSVARRITFYFFVFGLVVFLITSMLYMGSTRRNFINSTSQLINHQFSLMDSARTPDFLWKGIGKPMPELLQLFQILKDLSSSFYQVTDISIYAKADDETVWYRLFFDENNALRLNPAKISSGILQSPVCWRARRMNMHCLSMSPGKMTSIRIFLKSASIVKVSPA